MKTHLIFNHQLSKKRHGLEVIKFAFLTKMNLLYLPIIVSVVIPTDDGALFCLIFFGAIPVLFISAGFHP